MTRPRGRPFKPGQSGNPAGRPRVPDCLTDCLRAVADEPARAGQTKAQALAAVLWRKALAGDLRAAAIIYDRCDGRPGQRVELAGGGFDGFGGGIAEAVARAEAMSEFAAKMSGSNGQVPSDGTRQSS